MEENNSINNEQPKKKSNTGLIVFFIIIILGLAGYICYDKFLAPQKSIKCSAKSTNSGTKDLKEEKDYVMSDEEALQMVSDVYKKAFEAINGTDDSDGMDTHKEKTFSGDVYYEMNIDAIKPYFSNRALSWIKYNLLEDGGKYYDIYNDGEGNKESYYEHLTVDEKMFGSTDKGLRPLTIVSVSENVIYATGQLVENGELDTDPYPLGIVFVKENDNWVIDLFE